MDLYPEIADDQPEKGGIQVIARAAAILRTLEMNPDGLSLGEIAKTVGLPRSTVQRIVDALARENMVTAASVSRGVRLGPALVALGAAARFQIADLARPTIEAISRVTGETVDLAILDQDRASFIDQVPGMHRLQAVSAIGVSFPLHCAANGKAMLAVLPEDLLGKLRRTYPLNPFTANTITTWAELDRELASIRARGIAFDREEQSVGISAVATWLKGPGGEIAAISIPVPTQRFGEREAELVAALQEHCSVLRQKLARGG
jgi:DNA-binding IclR family transcriptional regulator